MRALVVGYGSIGTRHARLLEELGCKTAFVTRRQLESIPAYLDIGSALRGHQPDYVVVANATNQHYEALDRLAAEHYRGRVLVEKPLFDRPRGMPLADFRGIHVAYNLRFHPVIQHLRSILAGETVLSVQAYVGQYLPDWRPGTDYRTSYSANASRGGGALRDLSHELDYLAWLFGDCLAMTALGGHVSALETDTDDIFVLLMQTRRCPVVTVQVSYLDRVARRHLIINTENHMIEADLMNAFVRVDKEFLSLVADRDHTYREMHRAVLEEKDEDLCTIVDGMATLQLIEAAERANREKVWIQR